jgi:hypothetical protein
MEGEDEMGSVGIDGEDNIKMILKMQNVEMWTGFIWLNLDPVAGSCVQDSEPFISINDGEFLD